MSTPGNLHISSFVRLAPRDPPAQTLALLAGVALLDATTRHVPAARLALKWPNDLLLDGSKLAGILLERHDDIVVLGFGANLAGHPTDVERPAISLAGAGLAAPSPQAFADVLAASFSGWLTRWRGEGVAALRDAWLARAHPLGTRLKARLADGSEIEGAFDGLAEDGALRLRPADGSLRVIHAGDVFTL
jgi:BirA family biotin operon repressor/biotin-[acetyl-CoA-carboxylase] ligase